MKTSNRILLGLLGAACIFILSMVIAVKANDVPLSERKQYEAERFEDTGELIHKKHSVAPAKAIYISGIPEIELTAESKDLQIWATDQIHDFIQIKEENGRLNIDLRANGSVRLENQLKVSVPITDSVGTIELNGVFNVFNQDTLQLDELYFSVNGSTRSSLDLVCNTLTLRQQGSTDTRLAGTAETLNINCSGSSNVRAANLAAKFATVSTSGSANVTINASETLSVQSGGNANVRYLGNPDLTTNLGGSSAIKRID